MKYLKQFESHNTQMYFKSIVNWKLYDYIKDITLEYADKGHTVVINVRADVFVFTDDHTMSKIIYHSITNYTGEPDVDEFFNTEFKIVEKENPLIQFYILIKTKEGDWLNMKSIDKIYNKIRERFPVKLTSMVDGTLKISQTNEHETPEGI